MKRKDLVVRACIFLLVAVPIFAQNAYFRTTIQRGDGTTEPFCIPWVDSGARAGTAWANTTNYIEIFPSTVYQTITGWGGTVQERHWVTMSVLSTAGKDSVMRALFDTSGCNINYLRCPIGCCDFDINEAPISLDETTNDYSMTNFSLHRDSTRKIPLIKMAQAINPNIKFWGCPWSPPRWMHDNGDFETGNMKSDAQTQTAYALYLEKFITGYKTAGINVDWICCQNEPTITDGGYPKCGWANTLEQSFYKNYMIPKFTQDNISTRIILGVFCCGNYADWITSIMNDATVAGFVNVTSHSYQDPEWGPQSLAAYPTIPYWETEAPFGPWPTPTDPLQLENWARGVDLFNSITDFMNDKASVYTIWNMVNDQTNMSGFNWMQTIAIRVNSTTKQVTYLPWFYALKHFGYYVKPGAKAVRYTVNGASLAKVVAFTNPNGDVILELLNTNATAFALTAKVGNMMYKASLPPNSFNTLKIASGTAVQEKKLEKTGVSAINNARICNSNLYFTIAAGVFAQEMNITLTDLQGRTMWTGNRSGSELQSAQQVFALKSAHSNLSSGTYILAVKIKNEAGVITTLEKKVAATN